MVQFTPLIVAEGAGAATQLLPFQLEPLAQLAVSDAEARTVVLLRACTVLAPLVSAIALPLPLGAVECWRFRVVLSTFGVAALLIVHVTLPLQVLAPAAMVHPVPEMVPVVAGAAQAVPTLFMVLRLRYPPAVEQLSTHILGEPGGAVCPSILAVTAGERVLQVVAGQVMLALLPKYAKSSVVSINCHRQSGGGATHVLPFQLDPLAQLAVRVAEARTVVLLRACTVLAPLVNEIAEAFPLAVEYGCKFRVALNTFGELALVIFHVTVPLQVLAPAAMVHPVPEIVPAGLGVVPATQLVLNISRTVTNPSKSLTQSKRQRIGAPDGTDCPIILSSTCGTKS